MIAVSRFAFVSIICLLLFAAPASAQKKKDNTPLVDVFIGTEGNGHTSPGVNMPYAMVHLSPISRLNFPGYQFTDTLVYGFAHLRSNLPGDDIQSSLLFMPTTGEPDLNISKNSSPYKKKEERASPGYYGTMLTKHNIRAEFTATKRAALHLYDFPKAPQANIIIDLQYGGDVEDAGIEIVSKNELRGHRTNKTGHIYFYAKFSKPFSSYGVAEGDVLQKDKKQASGKNIKAYVQFDDPNEVIVKVGLSHVSTEGAMKNLDAELPGFDFKNAAKAAKTVWIDELAKIQVEGGAPVKPDETPAPTISGIYGPQPRRKPKEPDYALIKRSVFYTALYHTLLTPAIGSDVNGQYRSNDNTIATAKDFTFYNLAEVHGSNLPLFQFLTLMDSKRTADIIKSYTALPFSQHLKTSFIPLLKDAVNKGIIDSAAASLSAIPHQAEIVPFRLSEIQLDSLFNDSPDNHFNHLPYMYSFTRSQYKAQGALNKLIKRFTNSPTGLPFDDSAAQLSAWYVMSSLGIYNLVPAKPQYIIGLPQFDKAVISLPNDKKFTILNPGAAITRGNIYLQGLNLNKQGYNKLYLNYTDIAKGGELEIFTGTIAHKLFMDELEKPELK